MKERWDKAGHRINGAANAVVKLFGCLIMLFLLWYNMRYTQHTLIGKDETMNNEPDSMVWNLAAGFLVFLAVWGLTMLERRLSERHKRIVTLAALGIAMLWLGVLSCWWITGGDRVPWEDQAYVYGGASYIIEGDFHFFRKFGYFEMHPYQLGLVFLMELLFRIVGTYNYPMYEILCGFMTPLIVYFGYKVVEAIRDSFAVKLLYCVLISCCLPLVFYTSWVYGELPYIMFTLFSVWMLLRYCGTKQRRYLLLTAVGVTLAVTVRTNAMIVVAALCLVMLVYAVKEKDVRILAGLLLVVLMPVLVNKGIIKMYEIRTGYELDGGKPAEGWIAMAMQKNNWGYGWYSYYPTIIYNEADGDREEARRIAVADIRERLKEFAADPSYAWTFYREKLLSQWNDPLYQSIQFNTQFSPYFGPDEGSLVSKICYTHYFTYTLLFCDRLQFVVYLGVLLYFLLHIRLKSSVSESALAVTVIGCFLFSIIWEAKARYNFPCYVTMFPLAAVGYGRLAALTGRAAQQLRQTVRRRQG